MGKMKRVNWERTLGERLKKKRNRNIPLAGGVGQKMTENKIHFGRAD